MARYNRRRRIRVETGQDTSIGTMMNLSLFIMLLAFFIVLNALSMYEEIKSDEVRRSVTFAFSNNKKLEEYKESQTDDPTKSIREGHAFDRIDALFKAQIASFDDVKSKSRGVMMVELPYDEFVRAVMAVGQRDLMRYPSRRAVRDNFFLPTLISVLKSEKDGLPTRMEILLNTKDNPALIQNQSPAEMKKLITTVGQFSQRLESRGMSQKLMNIGVKQGNPRKVNLVFRKYIPFSPVDKEDVIDNLEDGTSNE